jgi:uncharacterized protein YceH (UPF0502 family)
MSDVSPVEQPWPVLTGVQRRLLGVLVEKSKTTPDAYPLSLNALTVGSNQKSNRDPILNLTDDDVEQALPALMSLGLVSRITGSRVDRWRHNLYDVWKVDKIELAILAELLLRGPQTEGELRQHAGRMDAIPDLETLRQKLKPLQDRKLVFWLGEEGRRGSQITHGFHAPAEFEALKQRAKTLEAAAPAPAPPVSSPVPNSELATLREELAALRTQFDQLREEVRALKQSLGA